MNFSIVILVLLPVFLDVVYGDESTHAISSVLELFPEFKRINDMNKQINERIKRIEKGWTLPYKTSLRNYRVKSEVTASTVFSSGLECWIKCTETNGCSSASFLSEGGKCELSRVTYINYEVLEKAIRWNVFTKHTPIVSFHNLNYEIDIASGNAHCVSLGLSIATLDDMKAAVDSGYPKCKCGWALGGTAYLGQHEARDSCQSSYAVYIQCLSRSSYSVYCRPLKTD